MIRVRMRNGRQLLALRRATGGLIAATVIAVALASPTPALAAGASATSVSINADCGALVASPPFRSGARVFGPYRSDCPASVSLTARLFRDGTQFASRTYNGSQTNNLSMPCAAGEHFYRITLRNNSNGVQVGHFAWITC